MDAIIVVVAAEVSWSVVPVLECDPVVDVDVIDDVVLLPVLSVLGVVVTDVTMLAIVVT